jgi:RHH-type proline utilization regulon transcriptional repressor/proline dehydrogenase/delta 1-pyrroline-5-carboxylate dehydrogenase
MKRVWDISAGASAEVERFGGRVILNRTGESPSGYSLGPAIFEIRPERALLTESYASTELFAPIIHIIEVRTLDQALNILNATDYALTAGIYSQSQDEIDYLLPEIEAGNIYVNRGITGARVDIEPFGGFKFSGTGPKAGGKNYLPAFHHYSETARRAQDRIPPEDNNDTLDTGKSQGGTITTAIEIMRPLYGEFSAFMESYNTWLGENLTSFISSRHYNRDIPGQLSYNDYSQHEEQALFIIASKKLHLSTLMRILSALALGVKIIVEDNARKIKWEKIPGVEVLNNVDNLFIAGSSIRKIVFDAESSSIEKRMNEIYEAAPEPELLKLHYSQYDAPPADDYSACLLEFIRVRSIAINTMKHGAELKR